MCGNYALNESNTFGRKDSLWKTGEQSEFLVKDECKSWFAQVGPARDLPLLFKWTVFGEVVIQLSLVSVFSFSLQMNFRQYTHYGQHLSVYILQILSWKDQLGKPVYMLCCYFVILLIICLYYIIWALTHPLSAEEIERLKDEQRKLKFLDMVPWYSGTSSDLFKTAFDLLVSVTVFMGRFVMRMMQAAMNGTRAGAKQEDFLYDHFKEKDNFWFDFMANTGDGGNSSYSVARLLAQPSLDGRTKDYSIKLPHGDLLLIVGDLA
ncbi:hypothetical protein HanPI659440_Chr07g0254801 [Helianthus annuus]|nr:hypothetical protein HanPI659440_Chr07g0254801 [Helianthus annuus]